MNRIGFQFNNSEDEDIFKVFDDYVDSSKEKLTKAADNLMKLYKSKDLDDDSRKTLIDFEKKLRMIFKQVDDIDREVEEISNCSLSAIFALLIFIISPSNKKGF